MNHMYAKICSTIAVLLLVPSISYAFNSYVAGKIINITSTGNGMMMMLDTGVPDNCQGTPYNWMLIKESHKTMLSVALAMWATGKNSAVVYTSGLDGTGYCIINQLDPTD